MRQNPKTNPIPTIPARLVPLLLAVTVVFLMGASCLKKDGPPSPRNVHIPNLDTPSDQFYVAVRQERDARGLFEPRDRQQGLQLAMLAYERVVERFPEDDFYTPASDAKIGALHQEAGAYAKAITHFQGVLERHPNDRDARLLALSGLGGSLDELNRPQEAEVYYRMLVDEFQGDNSNPSIIAIVQNAQRRLRTITVLNQSGRGRN